MDKKDSFSPNGTMKLNLELETEAAAADTVTCASLYRLPVFKTLAMPPRPGAAMHNVPLKMIKKKKSAEYSTSMSEMKGTATWIFGPGKADKEDIAAMVLQRCVLKRLVGYMRMQ